jgi:hypothetical protein
VSLPVVRTCRECGHWRSITGDPVNGPGTICGAMKPKAYVHLDLPPPRACPLRKETTR